MKKELLSGIIKSGDDRLVYGWASVVLEGDQVVVDLHDDVILERDLMLAAHGFIEDGGVIKVNHMGGAVGHAVESAVFTSDLQKALGVDLGKIGWLLCAKIDEDKWPKVKADIAEGKFSGFSIGGIAEVSEYQKAKRKLPTLFEEVFFGS